MACKGSCAGTRPLRVVAVLAGCAIVLGCRAPKTEDRGGESNLSTWARPAPTAPTFSPEAPGTGTLGQGFDLASLAPQAAENYVFVPNPRSHQVVAVDSRQLQIRSVATGNGPTHLETIPGQDAALVINVQSADLSLIRVHDTGLLSQQRMVAVEGANTVTVAPDGEHAVVFFNADTAAGADGDVQGVSVLTLTPGQESSSTMTVGFKPERVEFSDDGSRAFVISERNISILDFAAIERSGPGIAPAVEFDATGIVRSELIITADGAYAIGRPAQGTTLRLLDLTTGQETVAPLWSLFIPEDIHAQDQRIIDALEAGETPPLRIFPTPPVASHLQHVPGTDHCLATFSTYNTVVRIPIPEGFSDFRLLQLQQVDADIEVAHTIPGTHKALTFRPGQGSRILSLIDFDAVAARGTPQGDGGMPMVDDAALPDDGGMPDGAVLVPEPAVLTVDLRKSIDSVRISSDGASAVVVHGYSDGDPYDPNLSFESKVSRSRGHSLVDLATLRPKLELTRATVDDVIFTSDSRYAFLLFDEHFSSRYLESEHIREVHRVDLRSFVTSPILRLDSAPIGGASVPGQTRVFITQAHSDGRLTFIDWNTAEVETVTGLELNSRIEN